MKIAKSIPVYLLAIVYLVFGINFFFPFIKMQAPPGDAGAFIGLLYSSKYLLIVKIIEVVSAVLLLIPKTRALALLLIAPVTVNILLYEALLQHQPGPGHIMIIVQVLAIYFEKDKYKGII